MRNAILTCLFILITTRIVFSGTENITGNKPIAPAKETSFKEQAKQWVQCRPVKFLENKGQMTDMEGKPVPFVLYKAESHGMNIYITEKGITYLFVKFEEKEVHTNLQNGNRVFSSLGQQQIASADQDGYMEWERVDMEIENASIKKENITKENPSVTDFNFFLGHCPDGIYGTKEYEKITISDIYPGIDWVLYNSGEKGFKYDFVVHPKADHGKIQLTYRSLKPLKTNKDGSIEIETQYGTLKEQAPYSYIKETQKEIKSKFQISNQQHINNHYYETTITLQHSNYKHSNFQTLIIDPQIVWATIYGGPGIEGPMSIDCDAAGNVFITGYITDTNFPVLDPGNGVYFQGALAGTYLFDYDAFILKFNNAGVLIWATYYGGSGSGGYGHGRGLSICVDVFGNIFITGQTGSPSFPVQNPGGGAYYQGSNVGSIFILKFNTNGVRLWATYYQGNGTGKFICSDLLGNIYVTGSVKGGLSVLNPGGGAYFQSTFSGSSNLSFGDVFILKFNNSGVRLWATYYGGSGDERGYGISTDIFGNVFFTGTTTSGNFPTMSSLGAYFQSTLGGVQDAFIIKFSNSGVRQWATLFGGDGDDYGYSAINDLSGNVFIIGSMDSTNFPVFNPGGGAYFQGANAGKRDVFILKFSNAGSQLWSTLYGGVENEFFEPTNYYISFDNIESDPCGNIYVSFWTESTNLPIQQYCSPGFNAGFKGYRDNYIIKFNNSGVQLWATYTGGPGFDFREALALDKSGSIFVTGEWQWGSSSGYPYINPGGGAYFDNSFNGNDEGYVAKYVLPVLTIGDTVISAGCSCIGSATVTASGGCSPFYYTWYDSTWAHIGSLQTISNLCPGTYHAVVTDSINCFTDTASVVVSGSIIASTLTFSNSQTNPMCNGDSTGSVTVTPAGGVTPYTYSWLPNSGGSATATGLSAGTYTITVADSTGCTISQIITMTEPSIITTTITTTPTSCTSASGNATVNSSGGTPGYEYSWNNGQTTATATGLAAGTYTAIITDANGCMQTQTVTVTQTPGPIASVSASSYTITNSAITTLTAGGGGTYQWFPVTGLSCITCPNPTATPSQTTLYCVFVTDTNNCSDSACITINVEFPCGELFIPNAFSPNNDLENDMECVMGGNCIQTIHFIIYDRWGEKVFETTDPAICWHGTFKGKLLDAAVFVYYMNATLVSGEEITKKGNISLIR